MASAWILVSAVSAPLGSVPLCSMILAPPRFLVGLEWALWLEPSYCGAQARSTEGGVDDFGSELESEVSEGLGRFS